MYAHNSEEAGARIPRVQREYYPSSIMVGLGVSFAGLLSTVNNSTKLCQPTGSAHIQLHSNRTFKSNLSNTIRAIALDASNKLRGDEGLAGVARGLHRSSKLDRNTTTQTEIMPKEDPETTALKKELTDLIAQVKAEQEKVADAKLSEKCSDLGDVTKIRLSTKKTLKGHINKVNSVHYSGDSRHCVTGSLDGKLIIWDTWSGNKVQVIPLRSAWVMSVAFAPSGNFVACGGMDNMCTVYDVNNRDSTGAAKMVRELAGYEGFLSSCRFLDDTHILTGSGDMKICVWDLEVGRRNMEFDAHAGDVVSISLAPDMKTYVTGSVDKTCKLWDVREDKAKQTFFGHEADVNSVCYHNSGQAFATASEDKTARLFDIRSDQQLGHYTPPGSCGFTSCGLSLSGRYLLAGSDDNSVHSWDTLKVTHTGTLNAHENRVTSIAFAPNGIALASCSWDQSVKVWG